ncbi:hypothetical protein G210_3546 [Candida maltosa Xu316]|uniref:Uncharacterized protein n=1 Tax=Candida maltosa (strain Xu316) TaxID=1245528 RepID=M3JTN0_CANMX|nr:hypothetical protein G210_3546 [Candida maltosa Xu316]
MTNKCKLHVLAFEDDYNELFGPYTTSLQEYKKVNSNWEEKSYSNNIQPSSLELIGSTLEIFEEISKNLVLIDLFFESFNNLKKLLIPFLNEQTKSVIQSLVKLKQFLNVTISVDQPLDLEDYNELVNMKKVEKITSGIERESIILETAFLTFNTSLKQYTSILLGKAILKRDVDARDCELIARRAICYQAAEHVVSIPLTEDSPNKNNNPMEYLSKYLAYVVFSLVILVSIILYRLFKVLLS